MLFQEIIILRLTKKDFNNQIQKIGIFPISGYRLQHKIYPF